MHPCMPPSLLHPCTPPALNRFGPLDLLEDASVPLLLEQQSHALSWAPAAQAALQQRAGDEQFQRAAAAALAAAQDVVRACGRAA